MFLGGLGCQLFQAKFKMKDKDTDRIPLCKESFFFGINNYCTYWSSGNPDRRRAVSAHQKACFDKNIQALIFCVCWLRYFQIIGFCDYLFVSHWQNSDCKKAGKTPLSNITVAPTVLQHFSVSKTQKLETTPSVLWNQVFMINMANCTITKLFRFCFVSECHTSVYSTVFGFVRSSTCQLVYRPVLHLMLTTTQAVEKWNEEQSTE